ncbi:unnamed protein product [Chrysodeixis includens]|uniref:ATP-dependent DNA helicase n=1 Tax=Chrysodeixis includens TaxID=689277 RepID=A0A9P0BTF2_CHRIL|nr:unnamed protein product [Chrysodeixis includens]
MSSINPSLSQKEVIRKERAAKARKEYLLRKKEKEQRRLQQKRDCRLRKLNKSETNEELVQPSTSADFKMSAITTNSTDSDETKMSDQVKEPVVSDECESSINEESVTKSKGKKRKIAMTSAERQKAYRQRKKQRQQTLALEKMAKNCDDYLMYNWKTKWACSNEHFKKTFIENEYGFVCSVCDRLWFRNDLKKLTEKHATVIKEWYSKNLGQTEIITSQWLVCLTCKRSLAKGSMPILAKVNGFKYPERPDLPVLDPISERLISPLLPFMQVRRLWHDNEYGIVDEVINMPIDSLEIVNRLPRQLDQDLSINVNVTENFAYTSVYLNDHINKQTIVSWLDFLQNSTLYSSNNIIIDINLINTISDNLPDISDEESGLKNVYIEKLDENTMSESRILSARKQTMIWNEEKYLDIASGRKPKSQKIRDNHFEELSFPSIYYGEPREYNRNVKVTPSMIASSEIRRADRRGASPQKLLYVAMKLLRIQAVDKIYNTFKCVPFTENISRRKLEDKKYIEKCLKKNVSFLKSVPNTKQYWSCRKRDLFAMIRQLGKPTVFLTLSANEIRWPILLNVLNKLNTQFPGVSAEQMTTSQRCKLVSEDPVTCCIYFYKLVKCLLTILKSQNPYNPFGHFKVLDFFTRFEFQERGSPVAHILLWLDNDPKEIVSEQMPKTIELIEALCSVSTEDLPDKATYENQVHRHTFTCYKKDEKECRFRIPYWPMEETCVLLPMSEFNKDKKVLQDQAASLRQNLKRCSSYTSIAEFLADFGHTQSTYLDVIRSSLKKPTLFFKRNMNQTHTTTFNPWISGVLCSNMNLQIILNEYSCAAYIVQHIHSPLSSTPSFYQKIIELLKENPERDYTGQLKAISYKLLNEEVKTAQEAAWFLLKQPLSETSRKVTYIPTVWVSERQKSRKSRQQMDKEGIHSDSTDVWTKNVIQHYEERPSELELVYLAEFVAWYRPKTDTKRVSKKETLQKPPQNIEYTKRKLAEVIRFRKYEIEDSCNYKREMVLLFLPFRSELLDILDRNKFVELFDSNKDKLIERRLKFEEKFSVSLEKELALWNNCDENINSDTEKYNVNLSRIFISQEEQIVKNLDELDDSQEIDTDELIVRKRSEVMSKQEYCDKLYNMKKEQRELIHEVIHRLTDDSAEPIQIFFTGPAGSGKTFTLKVLMETYNRFSPQPHSYFNSYVTCASTGKAAIAINGKTVHSAFRLNFTGKPFILSAEALQKYRSSFTGVKCIIIDEISMLSVEVLKNIHDRLQEITAERDKPFGGLDIYLCGDLRQLPPVLSTPCYLSTPFDQFGGIWQGLDYFSLKQVIRQKDKTFSDILTKIGNGESLTKCELKLIQSRHKTLTWCDENVPNAIRLFYRNADVDDYNKNTILNGRSWHAQDILTGCNTDTETDNFNEKLYKLTVTECNGLPHVIPLALDNPYMLTSNIDTVDGLVNGTIGILRHIETNNNDESLPSSPSPNSQESFNSNRSQSQILTLWLEFTNVSIGTKAKTKCLTQVLSQPNDLSTSWVPLRKKIVTISLSDDVKCKRKQFPLVPARAITIHKSQGGTFKEIVYKYSTDQPQPLVYVAMSRVTSIDGLYIVTDNDDEFHFEHGKRIICNAPTIRVIREEFKRLDLHTLSTITKAAELFCDSSTESQTLIMSLSVHCSCYKDIETDAIIMQCEYLALSQTGMFDNDEPVDICNYECVARTNHSSDSEANGGVAIYKRISPISSKHTDVNLHTFDTDIKTFGDICLTKITANEENNLNFSFILGCVYVHSDTILSDTCALLRKALSPYLGNQSHVQSLNNVDPNIPIILCGNFNLDEATNDVFLEFMKDNFNLDYIPVTCDSPKHSTFARYLTTETFKYVSYFSEHRPLLNRISKNIG